MQCPSPSHERCKLKTISVIHTFSGGMIVQIKLETSRLSIQKKALKHVRLVRLSSTSVQT